MAFGFILLCVCFDLKLLCDVNRIFSIHIKNEMGGSMIQRKFSGYILSNKSPHLIISVIQSNQDVRMDCIVLLLVLSTTGIS